MLSRTFDVFVDDGEKTFLSRKGDGVQSLVALAVMKHVSLESGNQNTTIAIEEPESHLHPNAVHELRRAISEISSKNQVIITTHSPIFVNLSEISQNIIIEKSIAKPAKSIDQIRNALGVRFSDNLRNARIIVIVEGEDDASSLSALFREKSTRIKASLDSGEMRFFAANGASAVPYHARSFTEGAAEVHCCLDGDEEGKKAGSRATEQKSIRGTDINYTVY
jgi:Predicted ATPase